jgi:outer membrane receptor for ferrienterochelin and colicins
MKKMIVTRLIITLLFLLGSCSSLFAQFTVKGRVMDAFTNEELIGVNIFTANERGKGVTSNFDGTYEIVVPDSSILVFRYVGYVDQTFLISSSQSLHVKLKEDGVELNTIVVSASRRQEKILDAPASISVIDSRSIHQRASVNALDHLKNIAGFHVSKSGIQGGTPSVRGFNGYYSSDLMTLVDNRIATLPSLRINAYQQIPTDDLDLQRIEVLRGPASALYGPNTVSGVVHMITKSPIDEPETKAYVGLGIRSFVPDTLPDRSAEKAKFDFKSPLDRTLYMAGFRHAAVLPITKRRGVRMGYKISTRVFRGNDWRYADPNEPERITRFRFTKDGPVYLDRSGRPAPDGIGQDVDNRRDESISKISLDGRMDFRFKDDLEFILSAGVNNSSNLDMTPVGALQAVNWKYFYSQGRVRWKKLFAQAYVNGNDSGDTYYVPVGGLFIDKSKFYALQLQHSADPARNINVVYGVDAFMYRPDTDYSLHGRYEDQDNINEVGIYAQATYDIMPKVQLITATRFDYGTQLESITFSPRASLMYRPRTGQNMRLSFNRAFKTPGPSAYFVDVKQATIPVDISVRALGTPNSGFQYSFAQNPFYEGALLPQFRSPYGGDRMAYYHVGDPGFNNVGWQGILSAIKSQFLEQFRLPDHPIIEGIIDQLIGDLTPSSIPSSIPQVVRDLNSTTRSFVASDWKNLNDIKGLKPTIVQNYELGYKGVVAKIFSIGVDVYRSDYKNFMAPVTFVTPAVMFDADALLAYAGPEISQRFNAPQNIIYRQILTRLLDKNAQFGGNGNGTGEDELLALFKTAVSNLPIGVITPMQADGPEMLLVTRNIGDVTLMGVDFNFGVYLSKNLTLNANYTYVDKDSISVPGAQFGYVALNAPKHKGNAAVNYRFEKWGLNVGARVQWMSGYPVSTGNFVGRVHAYHDVDVDVSWSPSFLPEVNATLSIQNVYNNRHQFFIGSPVIGSMALLRLSYKII